MANDLGWPLEVLGAKLSARELSLRVTHKMLRDGYTFDTEKIKQFEEQKRKQRVEEFMQRARSSW